MPRVRPAGTVVTNANDNDKPFACDAPGCGSCFATEDGLIKHRPRHGVKRFRCDHEGCDSAFVTPADLTSHKRRHLTDRPRPHVCTVDGCGATFPVPGSLAMHFRLKHTKIRPFKCDHEGCTKEFAARGSLTVHMRVHTLERPYKCTVTGCCADFTQSGNLAAHERTHSHVRPFKCTLQGCNSAFVQEHNLKVHMRFHNDERRYFCDYPGCASAFVMAIDLTRHQRVHTGERPYECTAEGCGAAFTQSGSLRTHVAKLHTAEGMARQKRQEQRVARALEGAGLHFKREHQVDFSCLGDAAGRYASVDFLLDLNGHVVMLEVDEGQHRFGYDVGCDMARMARISESLAVGGLTLPLTFVRYNPNAYKVGGQRVKLPKSAREARLVALLRDATSPVYRDRPLTIVYLHYDCAAEGGVPDVVASTEYSRHLAECVVPCRCLLV